MFWLLLVLAISLIVVAWFVYPGTRKFLAGVATALALAAAALLTGLAEWLGGLG